MCLTEMELRKPEELPLPCKSGDLEQRREEAHTQTSPVVTAFGPGPVTPPRSDLMPADVGDS